MLLTGSDLTAGTLSAMDRLVKQFANIQFDGFMIYALMMAASIFICMEGYQIYRIALAVIGFAIGFTRVHTFVDSFELNDEQMLMAQVIGGIVCAVLASVVIHIGIFIAAYHFAQANFAAAMAALLMQHVDVPDTLNPVISRLAAVLVAAIAAWMAVKSERLVVVILTSVIGGFAAINFFVDMIPVFPVDISFFLGLPAIVWTGLKIALSAAGVGVQGIKKSGN